MSNKSAISDIPIWQIREAAQAWREFDARPRGIFGRRVTPPSVHDRIDDLVHEVAYLRKRIEVMSET